MSECRRCRYKSVRICKQRENSKILADILAERYKVSVVEDETTIQFVHRYPTRVFKASWWYILFQRYENVFELPLDMGQLFAAYSGLYDNIAVDPPLHYYIWHHPKLELPIPSRRGLLDRRLLHEARQAYNAFVSQLPVFSIRSDFNLETSRFYAVVLNTVRRNQAWRDRFSVYKNGELLWQGTSDQYESLKQLLVN